VSEAVELLERLEPALFNERQGSHSARVEKKGIKNRNVCVS
jgi:hypothetical protein